MKAYLGIDNGVTGSITIIQGNHIDHFPTPTKKELSYTKTKQYISRIYYSRLRQILKVETLVDDIFCLIERPMINPMRFKASLSAIRALESTLIVLEELNIPYQYIDSKEWQKFFLPKGLIAKKKKSPIELKKAAIDISKRLFPKIKTKDADSILIAEYARRMKL